MLPVILGRRISGLRKVARWWAPLTASVSVNNFIYLYLWYLLLPFQNTAFWSILADKILVLLCLVAQPIPGGSESTVDES